MSANFKAVLYMMASMLAFTLNDTCVKLLGSHLPLGQILTIRGAISSGLLMLLIWHFGQFRLMLPRRDMGLIGLRTGAELGATFFFLTALFHMPLANLTALMQLLPLTVTGVAAVVFREALGWRRISAILIGFCGMLLIVRPGSEGFNAYTLFGLLSVACVTLRDLSTRAMSGATPSLMVTLIAALAVMGFGISRAGFEPWVALRPNDLALLIAAGVFIGAGYFFSVQVMRAGQLYISTPFRYTGLIWALILGWVVFGDWPQPLTLLGAVIIIATGLFTLYREYLRMRAARL